MINMLLHRGKEHDTQWNKVNCLLTQVLQPD